MKASQNLRFARSPDGVRLAYASTGTGPLLIKAATWLSHLEFDWDSPVWSHLLRELSQQCTFVRYDERGCGLSDWSVEDLSFESWIGDLETVVDAMLHGGYARGRLVRSVTQAQREETETMTKLAELGWGKADPSFRQFFTTQFIPGGTPAQLQWFNALERISTSPANAVRFMREFAVIDVTGLLPQVRCPTLVLHSRDDVRVPFEEGRLIATSIPGARFVPIESGDHLLLEHEPGWNHWIEAVRAFLPRARAAGADTAFAALTLRQRELLELIAKGRDNAQIAATLGLSEKTVRNHITGIFSKLGVENRSQAIVMAREAGFGRAG